MAVTTADNIFRHHFTDKNLKSDTSVWCLMKLPISISPFSKSYLCHEVENKKNYFKMEYGMSKGVFHDVKGVTPQAVRIDAGMTAYDNYTPHS